jgi:hypothetical protein
MQYYVSLGSIEYQLIRSKTNFKTAPVSRKTTPFIYFFFFLEFSPSRSEFCIFIIVSASAWDSFDF